MNNIVLCSDIHTLRGLLACINSIIMNSETKFNYYVLVDKRPEKYLKLLEHKFPNEKFIIDSFDKYTVHKQFLEQYMECYHQDQYIKNVMNFARIYIPTIFPKLEKALYIDTDTIVQIDITDLVNMNMEGFPICACLNRHMSSMQIHPSLNIESNSLGFNTGVYVYDLNWWRNNKVTNLCENLIKKNKEVPLYRLGTQPLLNILYYNKVKGINVKYNQGELGWRHNMDEEYLKSCYILHWTGPCKPWLQNGLYKKLWEKYKI